MVNTPLINSLLNRMLSKNMWKLSNISCFCLVALLSINVISPILTVELSQLNDGKNDISALIAEKGGFPGIIPSPEVIEMYKERGEEPPIVVDWVDTPQPTPVQGERKVLTILIEFLDVSGNVSASDIYNRLYGNFFGSMRHYFLTVSFGKLTITGSLARDSYLKEGHNLAYWGTPSGGHKDRSCIYELAKEAVKLADPYVNFKNYDRNNDNILQESELSIQIVQAGKGEEFTGNPVNIWSHRWVMFGSGYSKPSGCDITPQDVIVDGVRVTRHPGESGIGGYTMQSALSPMGTFAHEMGHDLGLPDLYDTDYSSDGVGLWCLMGAGSWLDGGKTPALLSAWTRYRLGWVNPLELISPSFTIPVRAATKSPEHSVYIIKREGIPTEYFLIEYRSKLDYDAYLPGEGVLIWHIDDSKTSNSNENDRWVDLEEAHGGTQHLDFRGDGNIGDDRDPFYNQHKTEFTPTTDPHSKWKDGTDSGIKILGISRRFPDVMVFDFETPSYLYLEGPLAGLLNFDDYKNRMGSISSVDPSSYLNILTGYYEMYFPHFHQGSGWRTHISIVYPAQDGKGFPQQARVFLTAFDDNGNTLATKVIYVPNMNKISGFVDSSQFFGSSLSNKKGWIKVESDAPILGILNFENYPTNTLMGSVTGTLNSSTLYFPHFHQGGGWRSYISIVNTCSKQAKVTLKAYGDTGNLLAQTTKTISAHSKLSGFVDSSNIFGPVLTGKKGWIEVSGDCGIVGMMNFDNYPTNTLMGSYMGMGFGLKKLVFPHFHQGSGWRTHISIVNVGNEPASITLIAISEGGEILGSSISFVQPKSRLSGFVNSIFPGLSGKGWIMVYADKPNIVGLLNFDNHPTSTMMGSLEPCFFTSHDWETYAPGHIEFPHFHMDSSWRTYISIIRLGGKDYTDGLTRVGKLISSSGTLITSTTPALTIGQSKWSGTISQLFGRTGTGWVAVRLSDNRYWD